MNVRNKEFGKQTAIYRQQKGISQRLLSQRVNIDNTHLNRIERGDRNPPKRETVLRMAKALRLSTRDAVAYIQLAGYSPEVVGESNGDREASTDDFSFASLGDTELIIPGNGHTNLQSNNEEEEEQEVDDSSPFPSTSEDDAQKLLESPIPSWHILPNGAIATTNLLCLWLWALTSLQETLGQIVFEVYTSRWNIERIAMPMTEKDFWFVKLEMLKLLGKKMNSQRVAKVKQSILQHPFLRYLYFQIDKMKITGKMVSYKYYLNIRPPDVEEDFLTSPLIYLRFLVTVYITRTSDGEINKFVVKYKPQDSHTKDVIAQKYQEIKASGREYIQRVESAVEAERT